MTTAPPTAPLSRAPALLRTAHAAAEAAFNADPTQANWALLEAIIRAAIDLDDARRRTAA